MISKIKVARIIGHEKKKKKRNDESFTPRKYKINVIRTLTYRCFRICSIASLLQSADEDLKKLLLQNGYPQGIVTLKFNDVLNKNKNKPTEPVATVPKKDVIVVLPYIGLHSSLITKCLKSCVNRFYSFVNVKVIFQNTRRIQSFFPYKDRLNRSQLYYPKSFTKIVAKTATIFTLGKRSEDKTTEKRNISRPF